MIDPISFVAGLAGGGLCVLILCKAKKEHLPTRNQIIDDMDKIVMAQDLLDKITQAVPKSIVPMSRAAVDDMLEGRDYSLLRWYQWLWIYLCCFFSLVYYPIAERVYYRREQRKKEKQLANDTLNRFLAREWKKV